MMNYENYLLIIRCNPLRTSEIDKIKDKLRNFCEYEPMHVGYNSDKDVLFEICCIPENLTLIRLSIDIIDIAKMNHFKHD